MAATVAVEISGPTLGMLIRRRQLPSLWLISDLFGDGFDTLVQSKPVFVKPDDQLAHSSQNLVGAIF
jgi:hypothetical protein